MAKTRLTQNARQLILTWMMEEYDKKNGGPSDTTLSAIKAYSDSADRAFPKPEMAILRKYGSAWQYNEPRFSMANGRIFRISFLMKHGELLPFIPRFFKENYLTVSDEEAQALFKYELERNRALSDRLENKRTYGSFLQACRYVEDVLETVPLPANMLASLGSRGYQIVAINPQILESIKKDFSNDETKSTPAKKAIRKAVPVRKAP